MGQKLNLLLNCKTCMFTCALLIRDGGSVPTIPIFAHKPQVSDK